MTESKRQTRVERPVAKAILLIFTVLVAFDARAAAQDTAAWGELLAAHVSEGRVDYKALSEPKSRQKLETVFASFAKMPESAGLASWINAYNVSVVYGVVQNYPLKSVMDVKGFFKEKTFQIAGKTRTLDEIEHKVIRPRFKDARVHAALNCGAISCPPLHPKPFRSKTLDATLEALTKRWLMSERHVKRVGDTLKASELFFWFKQDFEREAKSVEAWIVQHAPDVKSKVEGANKLERISYDWRLNEKP